MKTLPITYKNSLATYKIFAKNKRTGQEEYYELIARTELKARVKYMEVCSLSRERAGNEILTIERIEFNTI